MSSIWLLVWSERERQREMHLVESLCLSSVILLAAKWVIYGNQENNKNYLGHSSQNKRWQLMRQNTTNSALFWYKDLSVCYGRYHELIAHPNTHRSYRKLVSNSNLLTGARLFGTHSIVVALTRTQHTAHTQNRRTTDDSTFSFCFGWKLLFCFLFVYDYLYHNFCCFTGRWW